jgi:hypothetical protein
MKLPGFLTPLGLLLATVVLLVVAGVVYADGHRIFSPGALSTANDTGLVLGNVPSHAALANDCAACHTAPWEEKTMADRCLGCHSEIAVQFTDFSKLHSTPEFTNCRDCHTEHQGANGNLTQIMELEVNHEKYNFSLATHQTKPDGQPFACADCHTDSLNRFDPATCVTCHRKTDPTFTEQHIADFSENCLDCHNGKDRFSDNVFEHNTLTFPLLGKHAQTACTACHTGVQDLESFKLAPTDCVDCHLKVNPHPPSFGTDCATCHNSESWQTEVFDHDLAAFKLTGKHQTVPCTDCHINNVFRGTPQTCVGCHAKDDVHLGTFGNDCAACHTTDTWKRGPFIHTFPLDHGGQGIIACATCHSDPSTYQVYTCYNCHNPVDIVRIHAFSEMMRTDITDCVDCHPTGKTTMRMMN